MPVVSAVVRLLDGFKSMGLSAINGLFRVELMKHIMEDKVVKTEGEVTIHHAQQCIAFMISTPV